LHRVGDQLLSQFVHLFELTITFESWLDHDEFSREELEVANQFFIPILIQMLVNNVKRKKNGMKLPKIHQLWHFVEQVILVKNILGRIGKTNLKEKVKRPSETMRMELHNIEFWTAVKDTDQCLIHKAACGLVGNGDTIVSKYISDFKTIHSKDNQGHNILGIRW